MCLLHGSQPLHHGDITRIMAQNRWTLGMLLACPFDQHFAPQIPQDKLVGISLGSQRLHGVEHKFWAHTCANCNSIWASR